MELVEEKPKKRIGLYLLALILIIAVVVVYFVFFSSGAGNFLSKLVGSATDLSLVPSELKKDVTGGIVNLKFNPQDILENPEYKVLRTYAEPVEIKTASGRPNPFIPF